MKVVINNCFGGFSLSPLAIKELAKRKGKECYFFSMDYKTDEYTPLTLKEAMKSFIFFAYSVPNPKDYRISEPDEDGLYKGANERAEKISLESRPEDRGDKDLVAVVEMLGEKANGGCAELKVVKIPDGVDYEISEYDGIEHIAEKHRTWD